MSFNDCKTNEERVEYFKGWPLSIEGQAFMNGNAKVGDPDAVRIMYRPLCRGIVVGPFCETAAEAEQGGKAFLDNWDGSLPGR